MSSNHRNNFLRPEAVLVFFLFGIAVLRCGNDHSTVRKISTSLPDSIFAEYSKSVLLAFYDADGRSIVINHVHPKLDTIIVSNDHYVTIWIDRNLTHRTPQLSSGTRIVMIERLKDIARVNAISADGKILTGYYIYEQLVRLNNPYVDGQKATFYDNFYHNLEIVRTRIASKYKVSLDSLDHILYQAQTRD